MSARETALLLLAAAAVVAVAHCARARTELVARIDSDLSWGPDGMLTDIVVSVRHRSEDPPIFSTSYALGDPRDGQYALPAELGIEAPQRNDSSEVTIEVSAMNRGSTLFVRRAIRAFVPKQTTITELFLAARCVEPKNQRCPAGTTCGATGCEPERVDGPEIDPLDAGPDDGGTDDGGCDGASCESDPDGGPRDGTSPDADVDPAIAIATGGISSCAARASGAAYCWGGNDFGQLGDDSMVDRPRPTRVVGLEDAIDIAVQRFHGCAVRKSGGVVCWGRNDDGKLGDGSNRDSKVPVPVLLPFEDASEVTVGRNFSCARRQNGQVLCWGANSAGQLGITNTTTMSSTPVIVPGLSNVVNISAYGDHACAARSDRTALCWGAGLGFQTLTPTVVPNLNQVDQVAVGYFHACVRAVNARCWGDRTFAQLGDAMPAVVDTVAPPGVLVRGIFDAIEIVAGYNHTCARRANNHVLCWGGNRTGALGNGSPGPPEGTPVAVMMLTDAMRLAAGEEVTCAIRLGGSAVCWGANDRGQIGDDTKVQRPSPTAVALP